MQKEYTLALQLSYCQHERRQLLSASVLVQTQVCIMRLDSAMLEQVPTPGSFHNCIVSLRHIWGLQQPQCILPGAQNTQPLMCHSIQWQSLQETAGDSSVKP